MEAKNPYKRGGMFEGAAPIIFENAKQLRKNMTDAEKVLWAYLRTGVNGLRFRRQHPAGTYVLDFACLEAKLAIEVDGEAHGRGTNPVHDQARDEWLMAQGYRTMRIPAREVLSDLGAVVTYILAQCQPLHRPSDGPPPRQKPGRIATRRSCRSRRRPGRSTCRRGWRRHSSGPSACPAVRRAGDSTRGR